MTTFSTPLTEAQKRGLQRRGAAGEIANVVIPERARRGLPPVDSRAPVPDGYEVVEPLTYNISLITDSVVGSGRLWAWPLMEPELFDGWTIDEWNEQHPGLQVRA